MAGNTFGQKAEEVIGSGQLVSLNVLLENHTKMFSEFTLRAFHQTHNFFALHLVTGAHAFRICRKFAPENADALFSLGILVGYLAIGAPQVAATISVPKRSTTALRDLVGVDEHNIKVAYSCQMQAAAWDSPLFEAVAEHYLRSQKDE